MDEKTQPLAFRGELKIKPDYCVRFSRADGSEIGALDFNGPEMLFRGEAEESAKVFFDWLAGWFAQRLRDEREACAKICETLWDTPGNGMATEEQCYGEECAAAIRANQAK